MADLRQSFTAMTHTPLERRRSRMSAHVVRQETQTAFPARLCDGRNCGLCECRRHTKSTAARNDSRSGTQPLRGDRQFHIVPTEP